MTFTLQPRPSKRLTPCSQPRIPCPAGHHPASPRENLGVRCGRGKTAKPGSGLDAGRSTSPTNWRRAGASRVPAVSDLLCAWPMLVFCAAPKLMCLLRTVPPNATDINPAGMEYGMRCTCSMQRCDSEAGWHIDCSQGFADLAKIWKGIALSTANKWHIFVSCVVSRLIYGFHTARLDSYCIFHTEALLR